MVQKPVCLKKGDEVRVVAPASSELNNPAEASSGLAKLRELGFKVSLGECVKKLNASGYLSGTDEQRADELNEAFRDNEIAAVFCITGGYGTSRMLPHVNYDLIKSNPKIFLGYSDITALHIAIHQKSNVVTFHGPMIISMGSEFTDYSEKWLLRAITNPDPIGEISNPVDGPIIKTITEGAASGQLVGGNISLMASTLGSPYEIDTRNKLLFVEEIDDPPYLIDRNLTALWLSGKLQEAAGIIVGEIVRSKPREGEASLSLWDMIRDRIGTTGKPAVYGFVCGHGKHHLTLPIGAEARLDATKRVLSIEENATER